jgi:predicted flap endonuclease-1-like 5' DNA nuclease
MEWLIAIIALIAGLVIGWWLANRAADTPPEPVVLSAAPVTAAEPADLLEEDPDPDDLKKIEGIGPKIAERLNMGGIYTYAELAATSEERLRAILEGAGANFRLADPSTWPEQAGLAAERRWDELASLQSELGRR